MQSTVKPISIRKFISDLVEKLRETFIPPGKKWCYFDAKEPLKTMENHKLSVNESDVILQNVKIKLKTFVQNAINLFVVNVQNLSASFAYNAYNKLN